MKKTAQGPGAEVNELAESVQEFQGNGRRGGTLAGQQATLMRAKRIARALIALTIIVTVWVMYDPHPYLLAIGVAAALPWLAIAIVWIAGTPFTLNDPRRNLAKVDLTLLLLIPSIVMPLRGFIDFQMLHWQSTIAPALIGGVIMTLCITLASPDLRARIGVLVLLASFLCMYCAGVTAEANGLLDRSTPTDYKVTILSMRYTTGKGAANYLTVSAWGPVLSSSELKVSKDVYRRSFVGGAACIELSQGSLAMPWIRIEPAGYCLDSIQSH